MPIVTCPKCRATLDLNAEYLGKEVECGQCHDPFVVSAEKPARSKRRVRRDSSWDDFDDDPDYYFSEAKQLVRGPGLGLMIANCLSLVMIVLTMSFMIFIMANGRMFGGGPLPGVMWMMIAFWSVFGMLGVTRLLLGFLGGRALMGLKSNRMAMTGAIASVVPMDGFLSVMYIPFGIWALVTLQKPVVKWAIHKNQNRER